MKRKNTLVKGIRVVNLIARKKEVCPQERKKFAIKKERVEEGAIALVALIAT